MNRIVEMLKINLPKKNIRYFLLFVVTMFTFSRFVYFHQLSYMKSQNIYDLIISMLSNRLVISYFLFIAYFFVIYNIGSQKEFSKYILTRYKNLKKWYNSNVIIIFLFSVIFPLIIVILCLLEGCLTIGFTNKWSEYSLFMSSEKSPMLFNPAIFQYVISSISPLSYVILNISYIIFFFFNIGVMFYILNIILKNRVWPFVFLFLLKCINDVIYDSSSLILKKLSFYDNIILLANTGDKNASLFYSPLIYWILFSFLIYSVGYIIICKCDMKFGDDL